MATLLVVEDEIVIALSMSAVLESEGHAVLLAGDGEDAYQKALLEMPDLVITDFMLPRMDGVALMRELRKRGFGRPIIVVTAIPEDSLPARARSEFDAYLGKPYRETQLLDLVRNLLGP
jgi:CheY-like chemotaxis protein